MRGFIIIAMLAGFAAPVARASAEPLQIHVCSGYSCTYRTSLSVGHQMRQRFQEIMQPGRHSPEAERAAIAAAVQFFERQATKAIGVADKAKGSFAGSRVLGQMDCIDESTNTQALLHLLNRLGLLRHHRVEANASRGFFLDRRYPHATAVIRAPDGRRWAVDSWYEPAGGAPDIMPLAHWRQRGVLGER
ncbi:hypothetical protein [Chelativorans sp. M5D2P16]|uniref:hypothetical protein n=1 Tax=Chelativorans sp. M5D2P16 TaxID=3095678 RepID=UPI002ACAAFFE|nr:hypothetical protein [Chelativorans sp. M5D2P16]MDZ5697034.1 hypothetical protein [Chelativorans sp. M5D2P16]